MTKPAATVMLWGMMLDALRRGAVLAGLGLLNAPLSARFRVAGDSMLPALADGESALAVRPDFPPFPGNRLRRGAVVVLTPPGGPGGSSYIKRIAALPGESVKLHGGRLYIDDVEHPWPPPPYPAVRFPSDPPAAAPLQEWWNGPDEYFVLGDNAARSRDSRRFGPVPAARIQGVVWLRCWPPQRWGRV